jgi:hypothetical protein
MIRTHIIPCSLPRTEADALNRESARIYTSVLVTHYRIYRRSHQRHWLSPTAAERLNDYHTRHQQPLLHAHSKDAAQQGFYKACKTAKTNREQGAKYPHKRKIWRTTVWKQTGIRRQDNALLLARARGLAPIRVALPPTLQAAHSFREVRLVTQRVPGSLRPPLYLAPGHRGWSAWARCPDFEHDCG